jgi:hypothetical protein
MPDFSLNGTAVESIRPLDGVHDLGPMQLRCLRVLDKFANLAFAARRLHMSQATLESHILELASQFGADQIRLDAGVVYISDLLRRISQG